MCKKSKTYIIVDDSYFSQLFLSKTINRIRPDFKLIGCADDTICMKELIERNRVNLIIMRDTVNDGNVVSILKAKNVKTPIIVISQSTEKSDFWEEVNIIGSILEPVAESDLTEALRQL